MKKNKLISIICPTHKRPALQRRFAKCVYENCYDPRYSEIVFGIDEDDQVALDVAEELKKQYGEDFIRVCTITPGENLPNISNICAREVARGQIYGNAADDVVFRSKNWDVVVLQEFEKYDDKILLLWSDDGNWGGSLASHYFVSKNWVRALGHIQPTHFHADWTDHWNQRLANRVGRAKVILSRERLFLQHLHAEHGGMEKDETYWKVKEKRERNVKEGRHFDANNPPAEFLKLHDLEYEKLVNFINNYETNKERG
jgi:hypothetical protein